MVRYGQMIGLDSESIEIYKKYHSNIWAGVAQRIRECNIRNYSIFHLGNNLFAYFEYVGNNFKGDMKKMADHEETQKWWAIMEPMQIPVPERGEGEWWANMNEVFHQE